MKLILTGATGFTGSEVFKQALVDNEIHEIVVLSRKPLKDTHPKLKLLLVDDFNKLEKFKEHLRADACIWALGISQTEVSREKYIEITYDYTVHALEVMMAANPQIRFCFLSGSGANWDETKARAYFGKIKGRTEKRLSEMSKNVISFRPGFIKPTAAHPSPKWLVRASLPLAWAIELFYKDLGVDVEVLAKCLLTVAKNGDTRQLLDNRSICELGG